MFPILRKLNKMSQISKFVRLLAVAVVLGYSNFSDAKVIPSTSDPSGIPVRTVRHSRYIPYSVGYAPYYSGSIRTGYLPAAYSYGYGLEGCSSCPQTTYYSSTLMSSGCSPCGSNCSSGCSPCGSNCSSGCSPCGSNCSSGCSGTGCSTGNCSANSSSADSLRPTPEPQNQSRPIEDRLEAIEKQLDIVPQRKHTTYGGGEDGFGSSKLPRPPRPGSLDENDSIKPDGFKPPVRGGDRLDAEPFQQNSRPEGSGKNGSTSRDSFKVNTNDQQKNGQSGPVLGVEEQSGITSSSEEDLIIPPRKPAPAGTVNETRKPTPASVNDRLTSKAISPRERMLISSNAQKTVVSRPRKSTGTSNWAGNPRMTNLAQYR